MTAREDAPSTLGDEPRQGFVCAWRSVATTGADIDALTARSRGQQGVVEARAPVWGGRSGPGGRWEPPGTASTRRVSTGITSRSVLAIAKTASIPAITEAALMCRCNNTPMNARVPAPSPWLRRDRRDPDEVVDRLAGNPLLATDPQERGSAWATVHRDLTTTADAWSELEDVIGDAVSGTAACAPTRLRLHDILLWARSTNRWDVALAAGESLRAD
ncbi:MAG: hypothetical protein ACR2H3_11640 [Acidimicrobiales bacterium]